MLVDILKAMARGSIAIAKRSGYRGQPCLVPRFSSKKGDMLLLVRTAANGAEYKSLIQDIKLDQTKLFKSTEEKVPFHPVERLFSVER